MLIASEITGAFTSFMLLIIGARSESNSVQKVRRIARDIVLWLLRRFLGVSRTSSSGFLDIRSLLP